MRQQDNETKAMRNELYATNLAHFSWLKATRLAILLMCFGVVPQQPPKILTLYKSHTSDITSSNSISYKSLSSFGRHKLGAKLMIPSKLSHSLPIKRFKCFGPNEQFNPIPNGFILFAKFRKSSIVSEEKRLPFSSAKTAEKIAGTFISYSSFQR